MVVVSPLVIHFRVSCCALCCTVPVFAEELEYMECFFFSTSHRFPWVESGFPLDSQKQQAGGQKTEWECTAGCTFGQLRGGHGRAEQRLQPGNLIALADLYLGLTESPRVAKAGSCL